MARQEAEEALRGRTLDDEASGAAAEAAFASARGREHNAFKIELGKRTLARALRQAAACRFSPTSRRREFGED